MCEFATNEKLTSQIPALQLLIGLGFEFLTPSEALRERQGRTSNVLLENILRNQLKEINRIRYKGSEYLTPPHSPRNSHIPKACVNGTVGLTTHLLMRIPR